MLLALIRLGLFGPIIVSGTFTCTGSDWELDEFDFKCYKTISGSPSDGRTRCRTEDPNAILMLAPTIAAATHLDSLFSGEKIWVGLRFRNGTEWLWDGGSFGPDNWGSEPQLCIGVFLTGSMYDYECYKLDGLICQKDINLFQGSCEPGWTYFGTHCFKRLRQSGSFGVNFSDGRKLCGNESAYIMMPQSQNEAKAIATSLDCGGHCWIGVTDFDADHIYTWEDGTNISQSSLYFGEPEPTKRDLDNICAYIYNGEIRNGECTTAERVICEKDAIDNSQTTAATEISTLMESTSTTYTPLIKKGRTTLATKTTQLESTSVEVFTTVHTSAIKTPSAINNSQTTASTEMSTLMENTSTTYTPLIQTNHTTSVEKLTEVNTSVIKTPSATGSKTSTPKTESKASIPYDINNTASGTASTGPSRRADKTVTTVDQPVVQYDNATIMPSTFLGHTISASDVPCIIQCIINPSEKINTINIPYKVDLKSLSSYRRRYKSADDPRMSSFYIGCVGIAVLVMSILFIIMLDCLPSA